LVVDLGQLQVMEVLEVQEVVQEMALLQLQVADQEHQVKEVMVVDNQRPAVLAVAVAAVAQHLQVQQARLEDLVVAEVVELAQHLHIQVLQ
jgi:hypothetical protein